MRIATQFIDGERSYTGPELRPHFILEKFKLQGSAVAAFVGPCEVKTEHLVDWEDRLAGDFIRSKSMLHFLGEFFGPSLAEGVLYQRLFMAIAGQEISRDSGKVVTRSGDDLYWNDGRTDRKLSVSIVTASPVSRLLHAGINLDATGAPVAAAGLFDLGISPSLKAGDGATRNLAPVKDLATRILTAFAREAEEIEWACAKVRPVV